MKTTFIKFIFIFLALFMLQPSMAQKMENRMSEENDPYTQYEQKNYPAAFALFQKEARQGEKYAQYNIGLMYDKGEGTTQNQAEAVKWYAKAANSGLPDGLDRLYTIYMAGRGQCGEKRARSRRLAQHGSLQKMAWAQYHLEILHYRGDVAETSRIKKDYKKAFSWLEKAAQQEHAGALNALGIFYKNGLSVPQSYEKAFKYYGEAARRGNEFGLKNLDRMLDMMDAANKAAVQQEK